MVELTSRLILPESAFGLSFGVRAQTEMKIWCIKGMCMLKIVSSEKNSGVKGLLIYTTAKLMFAHSCQNCKVNEKIYFPTNISSYMVFTITSVY